MMTKSLTRSLVLPALVVLPVLVSGCFSRVHMAEHYGRAYHEAFARQAVNPGAGENAKSPKGLDALEAGIVVETYRKQLAPQGSTATGEPSMILVSPSTALPGGYMPAPSPGK
jgi:hypothetical protein